MIPPQILIRATRGIVLALVVLLTTGAVSECDAGSSNWPEPPGTRPHGPWLPQMDPDGSYVVFSLGRSIFSVSRLDLS